MTIKDFDVASDELSLGSHLIEASAGTGKTYTIAMLVLRFVVEQGVAIDNLLVVTFTNAATAELRERVRLRLLEGQQALSGNGQGLDSNVVDWAKYLSIDKNTALQRLASALLNIDQAAIFTIHGFCQRALKEFALESGQLFDCDLTSDVSALRLQIAEDYWREHLYPRPLWAVSLLLHAAINPEQLLHSIEGVNDRGVVYPELLSMDSSLLTIEQSLESVRVVLPKLFQVLNDTGQASLLNKKYFEALSGHYLNLNDWLDAQATPFPNTALLAFTHAGIKTGLNGHKFRAKGGLTGDQRKQEYLDGLGLETSNLDQLQQAIVNAQLMFRRNLIERLRTHQDQKLQQLNQLSFDSLIFRLSEALQEPESEHLKTGLQQRYRVALIDEFQDTDRAQWHIFSTLFISPEHALYLIGDPKQAIYKFRGADVFSYFKASQSAQYHYSLSCNWRSHPGLVDAVNQLFVTRHKPFWLPELQFQKSRAGLGVEQGEIQKKGKPLAPMALWQLDRHPDDAEGYWGVAQAALEIRVAVVNEIVELLGQTQGVTLARDGQSQALQAQDIAILVRTNSQARDYQNELRNAGVPSVLNSTESVFAAPEAHEIFRLLQAIVQPNNSAFLKQALTLSWFNLDGQDLYSIINDEHHLDQWLIRFQNYYQTWQKLGLMAMMHQLLALEQVEINLARSHIAERKLTNIHHLIELLQQAIVEEHLGLQKTLEWLQTAIADARYGDEQQLRLESDEQAVKIVTLHRCKGLEYSVVFCPILWHRSNRLAQEKNLVRCHEDGEMIADLGSEAFKQRQQQAISEELSEDLRLLYVALTRAQQRCYLVWADVRSKNKPNISGLAYLLFSKLTDGWQQALAAVSFFEQQSILQNLVEQTPTAFSYRLLNAEQEVEKYYASEQSAETLFARQRFRSLKGIWRMTSYTALSALSVEETIEIPRDKAQEVIPKGAHTGNVIHQLLETINFAKLAQAEDITVARDQACQRYGLSFDQPALIDELLTRIVLTPLSLEDPGFCLANLPAQQWIKEMPFFYAFNEINSGDINAILADSPDFKPLSGRAMQGFLTGFIDLICSYQGKFYVMDYKTNSLENYEQSTLTEAMRDHNYGLQYWLYSLVLHQYLQQRLPDYSYQQHFGGVRYLFVRGMQPEQPASGVYSSLPDLATLERLTDFFRAQ